MRNLDMTMYWLLFNLDVGRLHQLPADGKTLIDHGRELGWRARRDRKTECSELLLHGVDFEHVHHRVIEPREKRRRGWRRRKNPTQDDISKPGTVSPMVGMSDIAA